jgi:phosphopantothenoylcysteine decarboxylase/phosphopantothenate--cysteine ligase
VPCSANTLAKLVHGLADDPVSLCFMAATCPKWVAPAMNSAMYASVAVQNNLRMLKNFENVQVLEASAGFLACGEEGPGRLIEPEEILNRLLVFAENVNPVFKGKKVLISAGRTREAIDTVRYISNSSSGKTAVALASVFLESGFSVTVVKGQMEAEFPPGVQIVSVESALDMHSQIMALASDFDVIVHAAAVADFRPKMVSDKKIKGSSSLLQIELEPNPNILRETVKQKKNGQVIVGFALETDDFEANAIEKLEKSGADLLVLNTPVAKNSGFGFDQVSYALLFDAKRIPPLKMNSKKQLAKEVLDFIKQAWTSSDDFTELHNA